MAEEGDLLCAKNALVAVDDKAVVLQALEQSAEIGVVLLGGVARNENIV